MLKKSLRQEPGYAEFLSAGALQFRDCLALLEIDGL